MWFSHLGMRTILFNNSPPLSQPTFSHLISLGVWIKMKFSEELIAPCGMNCNICSGYLAIACDVKSKGVRMSCCAGCRPRNKQCAFLKKRCTRLAKQKVMFCSECPKYPCENLTHVDTRYRTFFHMSLLENLTNIKNKGMDTFLREQEEHWRCSRCGGTICCHNGLCFQCDIETLKTKKKIYRWEDE